MFVRVNTSSLMVNIGLLSTWATCHPSVADQLSHIPSHVRGARVVVDGNCGTYLPLSLHYITLSDDYSLMDHNYTIALPNSNGSIARYIIGMDSSSNCIII
jgi:hypothetical protein